MRVRRLRLGTRGSRLAMRQAAWVAQRLQQALPGLEVELVPITTGGDRASQWWEQQASRQGGSAPRGPGPPGAEPEQLAQTGAFVRELEQALLDGRVDIAVHSLKDVPGELPAGLVLAAFPGREDARDALVLAAGAGDGVDGVASLPPGARVGTASLRRWVQLKALRPDLQPVVVRGNVDTRLARLDGGRADALVLAGAGLLRLGLGRRIRSWLDPEEVVPAPGQGALAVECRADEPELLGWLAAVDDPQVRVQVAAERGFLSATGAGCRWPVGALARRSADGGAWELLAFLAVPAVRCTGRRDGEADGWAWCRRRCYLAGQQERELAEAAAGVARELLACLAPRPDPTDAAGGGAGDGAVGGLPGAGDPA